MVSPLRRTRTSCEWRVRHPPPRQVALCFSCQPRDRRKATKTARGLEPDEGRQDPGWSHHMRTWMFAHGLRGHLQMRLGTKSPSAAGGAGTDRAGSALALADVDGRGGPRAGGVGPAGPSPGVSVAQKASGNGERNRSTPRMETPTIYFWSLHRFVSSPLLSSAAVPRVVWARQTAAWGQGPPPTCPITRVAGHRPHAHAGSTERASLTTGGARRRRGALSGAGRKRAAPYRARGDEGLTTRPNTRVAHLG